MADIYMDTTSLQRQGLFLAGIGILLALAVIILAWRFRPENIASTPSPQAQSGIVVSFEPPTLVIQRGEPNSIRINVDSKNTPVESFSLVLRYDPRVLSVTSISTAGSPIGDYTKKVIEEGVVILSGDIPKTRAKPISLNSTIATLSLATVIDETTTTSLILDTNQTKITSKGKNLFRQGESAQIVVQ